MANFHNPFSSKPDWAGGLNELVNQVMQFLVLSQMGGNGGGSFKQGMALPGAQTPQMPQQMPTMPQQRTQAPIWDAVQQAPATMRGGQMPQMPQMTPMSMKGGAPAQKKINPVNTAPGAGDIQTLMDMLSPEGKAILIGLLQQGTFKPITPPSTPGR